MTPTDPPCWLLTGFEPFGGHRVNPSELIVRALDGRTIGGARIVAAVLPCVFGTSLQALRAAIDCTPRLAGVIALGQAAGRAEVSLERVAVNVDDARTADNAGAQPIDEPVIAGGPAAYFSTLPIKAIVAALRAAGHPAAVSNTAGSFVCNHVFYGLQHALAARGPLRSGFLHVPLLPEQADATPALPSLPLHDMIHAVSLAVEVALRTGQDLRASEGRES